MRAEAGTYPKGLAIAEENRSAFGRGERRELGQFGERFGKATRGWPGIKKCRFEWRRGRV